MTFSQSLDPRVQIINNDTLFCFTIDQSKTIAKHLSNSVYCDTLEIEYITNIDLLRKINSTKDITITKLQHKINNLNLMVHNNTQSIENLKELIATKDKKLKRSKSYKRLLILGLAIAGTVIALK